MSAEYLIYGKNSCPYCNMAVDLLDEVGKEYDFVDLQQRASTLSEVKSFYEHQTVPIIVKRDPNDRWFFIGGYTELEALLKD